VYTGSAVVPDVRLDFLEGIYKPKKKVYAQIQFKDIPGVRSEAGATSLAGKYLDEVRSADVLVQVLRAFQGELVSSVAGRPEPFKELIDFQAELLLADMAAVEGRITRLQAARKPPKDLQAQVAFFERILQTLEAEEPFSSMTFSDYEIDILAGQNFLTDKPVIYVVNVDEGQLSDREYLDQEKLLEYARKEEVAILTVCAGLELEISRLSPEDRADFLQDLNLKETGLSSLARAAYDKLGLLSFFTVGDDEVRAWTIRKGTTAQKAAGKIHSDLERGFIRAEVFHYEDLFQLKSVAGLREKGLFRLEGKEYIVKDGDVITVRFNV
jgi:GTP-binding protein YchF